MSLLGPAFNNPAYRPSKFKLVGGIMGVDLRGMDANRHTGPRYPSKLETSFRTMRSTYTVAVSKCEQSESNEPVFKENINGDHRLLCIL